MPLPNSRQAGNDSLLTGALDLRPVLLVCGILTAALGAIMLLPAIIDFSSGNDDWKVFLAASAATTLFGSILFISASDAPRRLSTRQAILMTVLCWLFLTTFGAIPFLWSGIVPSFTDAFFESMSGLTTTGATVIAGLDDAPPGILFWRGLLQWIGGLGIIVMAVAVLPMLQIGGMQVFRAEGFDTSEKILPRATQISGSLILVFASLTAICAILYKAAGMSTMDAAVHAMTTVATGGFSTRDASIGHFDSAAIDWIGIAFMLLGSLPFVLYIGILRGSWRPLLKDGQVRAFLLLIFCFTLIAWAIVHFGEHYSGHHGLRIAAFNVISIMTGTGYATADYGLWGTHSVALFFFIMFIGGCAGSTSCGIKIFRFQILYADVKQQFQQIAYPHGVFIKRFNGRPIDDRVSSAVVSFFFLYLFSFVALAVALQLTGLDFVTAISGAGSAISNVGPGLGEIIGPAGNFGSLNATAKWLLSAGMLLGRLELLTALVLFLPRFWQS
jgi:trk system potassium uptake protein TrkH